MSGENTLGFRFVCPACGGPLVANGGAAWRCRNEGTQFDLVRGVWRFHVEAIANALRPFSADLRRARTDEGVGDEDPAYYRALPFRDTTGRFSSAWAMRAAGYRTLLRRVVAVEQARLSRRLRVVDLGAGNGWLSNRLSAAGHRVAAVDAFADGAGGLEAARHYENVFLPVEASYDALPFASSTVDVAIFNASLHHAPDVEVPLREALRVLRPQARLVILDTPIYRGSEVGAEMVAKRESEFLARFGATVGSRHSEGFLTMPRLHALSARLGVAWRFFTPFYGPRALFEPWRARLRGRREPPRFRVITAVAPPKWRDEADPRRPRAATHRGDVAPIETA